MDCKYSVGLWCVKRREKWNKTTDTPQMVPHLQQNTKKSWRKTCCSLQERSWLGKRFIGLETMIWLKAIIAAKGADTHAIKYFVFCICIEICWHFDIAFFLSRRNPLISGLKHKKIHWCGENYLQAPYLCECLSLYMVHVQEVRMPASQLWSSFFTLLSSLTWAFVRAGPVAWLPRGCSGLVLLESISPSESSSSFSLSISSSPCVFSSLRPRGDTKTR